MNGSEVLPVTGTTPSTCVPFPIRGGRRADHATSVFLFPLRLEWSRKTRSRAVLTSSSNASLLETDDLLPYFWSDSVLAPLRWETEIWSSGRCTDGYDISTQEGWPTRGSHLQSRLSLYSVPRGLGRLLDTYEGPTQNRNSRGSSTELTLPLPLGDHIEFSPLFPPFLEGNRTLPHNHQPRTLSLKYYDRAGPPLSFDLSYSIFILPPELLDSFTLW